MARADPVRTRVANVGDAVAELLDREFAPSVGHASALVSGCVFAPSILTFWLVNGLIDFSVGAVLGSLGSVESMVARVVAYVLLVPVFLAVRLAYYVAHPVHRQTVLDGRCPSRAVLSLDWFSVGILATGLPLSFQRLGPWLGMNAVLLVGLFGVPRLLAEETATRVKLATVVVAPALFVYAGYGEPLSALVPLVPRPSAVLGPVATLSLTDATVARLVAVANAVTTGPLFVAVVAVVMNRVLTRPEVTSLPVVSRTLPRRDPERVVVTSATLGTLFYLAVVAVLTGRVVIVP